MTVFFVGIGGACGAIARWLLIGLTNSPSGVFIANVLGSFLIGVAFVALASSKDYQALVMTGFLGGFTTFSAYSLEILRYLEDGKLGLGLSYALGSVLFSITAAFLGIWLARSTGV